MGRRLQRVLVRSPFVVNVILNQAGILPGRLVQRAAEELRAKSPSSLPNFVQYSLPKNLLPSRIRLTGCGVKTRVVVLSVRKFSDGNALPAILSQESFCSLPYMTTIFGRWSLILRRMI